ncbi:hypothetical protein [Novosphingobium sp.]|jgi:gas vesicle protein|uniref:hypothetical protein n=1 Tax=Novosphingobium sp. TaxID=1874826 RepID=UPI002FDFE6BC
MAFEIQTALFSLGGVVIGGGISSATTWLIARSERRKFAREKTWDVRRQAYTKIIAEMVVATSWANEMELGFRRNPREYEKSPKADKDSGEFAGCVVTAKRVFIANRLMLSQRFVAEFDAIMNDFERENRETLIQANLVSKIHEIFERGTKRLTEIGISETVANLT